MTDLRRMDDAQLVERVARADQQALAELHERHARLAISIAHRLVRDEQAAQEITQDAFVDLWRTAGTYDSARSSVTTWLVRLVRLRAIDRLRRAGAERRGAGIDDEPLDAAEQLAAPDDVAIDVERSGTSDRARAAVAQLPLDQRRVVELAFLHGFTHAELAEVLDVPIGTIKTRCFRGLTRLAELLADEHGEATS